MATSNQTVGSENKESVTPDGATVSADSQQPESATPPEAAAVVAVQKVEPEAPSELEIERAKLRRMGLNDRVIRRLLTSDLSEKYLNTRVTSGIALVFNANSMEELQRAQRRANEVGGNVTADARTRVAALGVVAQLGMAIARVTEVAVKTAAVLDNPERTVDPPPREAPVTNNFFMPPIVKPRPRGESATAKIGATTELEKPAPPSAG